MIVLPALFAVATSVQGPPPPIRGEIEAPEALTAFFAAARNLERGKATDDVRVAHFGDSHSTIDSLPRMARRALQSRFGDGGRGFVMLGRPWDWYNQDGIESGETKGFARVQLHESYAGPGGVSMHSTKRGSVLSTRVTADTTRVTLVYEKTPTGAPISYWVDETLTAVSSKESREPGVGYAEVQVAGGGHKVEVRVGDGDAWIYGVELDKPAKGIVYDALGIDGARASDFVKINEAWLGAYMQRRPASLVVLAYGANEAGDSKPLDEYERWVTEAIRKAKRLAPGASCLLIGPPDREGKTGKTWATLPRVHDVVRIERALASREGCAFFDTFAAMGGDGTAHAWRNWSPSASRPDHIHYTPFGYRALSEAYAKALMAAYEAWSANVK